MKEGQSFITKRIISKLSVVIMISGSLLAGCSSSEHVAIDVVQHDIKNPPNILWIYMEDQNPWNNAWGDDTVDTPNIQKLANSGVMFTQVFQPAPVCSASRSALITGQYQTTLNLQDHRSFRSGYNKQFLPKGYKTVPELFVDAGYQTFNIGKDDYNFSYDRSRLYNAHEGIAGFQGAQDGSNFDWANKLKNKPFFGQIQLKGGKHTHFEGKNIPDVDPDEMTLPPYYVDKPATRKEWAKHYKTQVMSDIELAEIIDTLRANGLLENTAIFWFSDHGMGMLRHKQDLYDGGLNVPLIVNWPAGEQRLNQHGKVRADLVSGLDIPATSLALAGIDVPESYDGRNLFADKLTPRKYVISAKDRMDFSFDRARTVRSDKFRYIRNFHPEIPRSQPQFRDKKPFSIEFRKAFEAGTLTPVQAEYFAPTKPVEELYDIASDPHQINNLADDPDYTAVLKEHRQILLDWIARTDDKGAYPESDRAIKETIDLWGKKCVSWQCESFRKRHPDAEGVKGDDYYDKMPWPDYMPKPNKPYYDEIEQLYRPSYQ